MIRLHDRETVEITGYCGRHVPVGFDAPGSELMLLRLRTEHGKVRYAFAIHVCSEDPLERDAAIDMCPAVELEGDILLSAVAQASVPFLGLD